MNIRPLHDRIVVRRLDEERTSAGGIVIPDSATEKPMTGEVLAVGNGKRQDNGERMTPDVNVGDKVLFGKYSGTEFLFFTCEVNLKRLRQVKQHNHKRKIKRGD